MEVQDTLIEAMADRLCEECFNPGLRQRELYPLAVKVATDFGDGSVSFAQMLEELKYLVEKRFGQVETEQYSRETKDIVSKILSGPDPDEIDKKYESEYWDR